MKAFFFKQHRQSDPAAKAAPQTPVQPQQTQHVQRPPPPPPPPPAPRASSRRPQLPRLSSFSSPAVQNSAWSSLDFMLGAGMVIFQPSTHKVVVVYETEKRYWFLPRGRKDVGESLEQAALREAYEETGYRPEFFPLLNPTHQPLPPKTQTSSEWFNTEPVYVTLTSWEPRKLRNGSVESHGGEYLTMWYVGQIPDGVTPDEGTGMADEKNYKSYLLSIDEAMGHLWDAEKLVLAYAWRIFRTTEKENLKTIAAESAKVKVMV